MVITKHNNVLGDDLTHEQIADIQEFGALEWGPRDIAVAMGLDIEQFTAEYNDYDSIVALAVARGRLIALAKVQKKILTDAQKGDIPAIVQFEKIRREKSFQASKLDIFGTFDDKKAFDRIFEYISAGKSSELSNNEQLFLDLLTITNSFDRRFGKRATVKFLTQQCALDYEAAVDYYNQANELFYSNRNTTKEALRQKYAEMYEDMAHTARNTAQTPKDLEVASNILQKAEKVRKLGDPDIQVLPPAMYPKQIRIFSLDPTTIGLPAVNRHEVAQQIDRLQIPEIDKQRLRRDALIEEADFTELLGNHGAATEN